MRVLFRIVAVAMLVLTGAVAAGGARAQTVTSPPPPPPPPTAPAPGAAVEPLPTVGSEMPVLPEKLPDVAPFEGKTVVALRSRIDGALWTKPPTLQAPKVGSPFTIAEGRAELARLLSGGGFASGQLEVNAVSGGVEVVFRLVPSRMVRRIVLQGNVLQDDEVKRAANITDLRDVTEKSIDALIVKVKAYYRTRGYPNPRVDVATVETDLPSTVVLQITIDPGPAIVVKSRVFAGLPTWDAGAVAAAQAYGVKPDDRADEEALELADRTLVNTLRGGGFPSATVMHSFSPAPGGGVVLTVNVLAGPKVIPSFEGSLIYDRDRLMEILGLENEADRSPVRLAAKIEAAYRRRGYYDVLVETEMLGAPTDAQRTLRFRIHEGHLVTVTQRLFPCLTGALSADRLDEEIDSFLDEEVAGEGVGDAPQEPIDQMIAPHGDVGKAPRPKPDVPPGRSIFVAETYEHAAEHLRELYRSEGYMFVEVGEVGLLRGGCAKGSMTGPSGCKVTKIAPLDEKKLCRLDQNQLPLPIPEIEKKYACVADPLKGIECAPTVEVVIPVNPGPRSFLWDVMFDGTKGIPPATLMSARAAGPMLRMGAPLSLRDVEAARKAIIEYYRDEGYAFVSLRANFEYSPDKSRARVRFLVNEGEQVTIDKIIVEGEKDTLESLIRDRLLIKEGGLYRAKLVRESQDRLAKLNVFSSVAISLVSPGVPAKRKTVIVTVVERKRQHFDYRVGFSTGEGFRFLGEYGYANLGGYAVSFDVRLRFSYQPFIGANTGLYDPVVVRRWADSEEARGLRRFPRRVSAGFTFPHTPLLGGDVRTTIEMVNILDLRRDFVLDKYSPILTFAYQPWRPFTMVIGTDVELNDFRIFDSQRLDLILRSQPALGSLLRVPRGRTGVFAHNVGVTFDFRDNRLGATKGFYTSLNVEYVRSILRQDDQPRQDFFNIRTGGAIYKQLDFLPKRPVFAFELRGGVNVNAFTCAGAKNTGPGGCDTYPDRLFYIGGIETNRGFFPGQMLPQDSIDQLASDPGAQLSTVGCESFPRDPATGAAASVNVLGVESSGSACGTDLASIAPRGGNVFINPRAELRVPAFKWGGFVMFVDASNTWRDKAKFQPFRLRYTVGPGISIDTPVGPVALDVGFNLSRHAAFGEPFAVFNFSIGRF